MTGNLKPVGFYSDTEAGEPDQPTLAAACGKFSGPAERMSGYLKGAYLFVVSGSGVYDEIDPDRPLIGALGLQTDGVWIWPTSYPYYVEKYQAEVPSELLELASSRAWVPPTFPDDAGFEERIPFGD